MLMEITKKVLTHVKESDQESIKKIVNRVKQSTREPIKKVVKYVKESDRITLARNIAILTAGVNLITILKPQKMKKRYVDIFLIDNMVYLGEKTDAENQK